jgi:hypothetical protein
VFANLFATKRELRRLAESLKYERGRADASEREVKRLTNLLLERDFAWSDRFLTSQVKAYPIDAEVKAKTGANTEAESIQYKTELTAWLLDQKITYEQDAIAAGVDLEQAYRDYQRDEPRLIKEFQDSQSFGFNN